MKLRVRFLSFVLVCVVLVGGCGKRAGGPEAPAPVVEELANRLETELRGLREEVERLADFIRGLHARSAELVPIADRSRYGFSASGVFHKLADDGGAALWVSASTPFSAEVVEVACLTEPLGEEFARICHEFPAVSQVYYNHRLSLNRIFPWFDTVAQFPSRLSVADYNFYYLADARHNPARRGVWVPEPYVDPAGRGWTVSAVAPVYVGDELEGVPGLDITVETLVDRYLGGLNRAVAVVSREGVIVAATESAILHLEMPPLKDHKYLETVKLDTFKPDEYNLLKSTLRPVRAMAERLLAERPARLPVVLKGRERVVHAASVPEVGWLVLEFLSN